MSLSHGGDLAPLHGLLKLFKGFFRNEFCGATLVYPAHQELLQTLLAVGDEPPLALTPAVAQSLGHFSQGRTLLGLEKLKHLYPVKNVAVSMALLQLLQLFRVFFDHPWVVYVRHAPIVPLIRRIGISKARIESLLVGRRQSNDREGEDDVGAGRAGTQAECCRPYRTC